VPSIDAAIELEDLRLQALQLVAERQALGRQIAGPVRLDVGTGWSRAQRGIALDLALSTNLPSLRAVSRSRYNAATGLEGTNLLEGSATYDRHLGRFEFGNGRLIGRARVVGRVYRDLNGNGRREADEPGLPGVRLRVGSRGVATDSLGRYSAWDLVPFEATSVEVDTLSITDPLALESEINQWPGVVTVGIFARHRARVCLLGTRDGVQVLNF